MKDGGARGQCILASAHFDAAYYREQNPDISGTDEALVEHFCESGWRQFRDPSAAFCVLWYRATALADGPQCNPLVHFLDVGAAQGALTAPASLPLTVRQRAAISRKVDEWLAGMEGDALACVKLAGSTARFSLWHLVVDALTCAQRCADLDTRSYTLLATAHEKQGQWLLAARAWQGALRGEPHESQYLERLGDVLARLGQTNESIACYQRALAETDGDWRLAYKTASLLEASAGEPTSIAHYYARACAAEPSGEAARYGVGVLHAACEAWGAAAQDFQRAAEALPDAEARAQASYRQGLALARCHEWAAALQAFEQALALKDVTGACHYALGVAQERLGLFDEAAGSYARALQLDGEQTDWQYRQALACAQAGRWGAACALWAAMPPPVEQAVEPVRDTDHWAYQAFAAGLRDECAQAWAQAAGHYQRALARRSDHSPYWFYRLAMACLRAGRFEEASAAFAGMRLVTRPLLFGPGKLTPEVEYVEFVNALVVQPRVILYESYSGRSMSCSPYALFVALLRDERFADCLHVWAVKEVTAHLRSFATRHNVVVVAYGSSLYRRYLAQAGYLIGNLSFPAYFSRRPGQRYLNTWHGTPLKNLGKGVKGSFLAYKNTARDFLQATHLISPNRHTTDLLYERYGVDKLLSAVMAETGYPRVDTMLNADEQEKTRIRQSLKLSDDSPVVLYAPTWRGAVNDFDVNVELILATLTALADTPCQLVFRGHYFVEELLIRQSLPVTVASAEVDTCALLAVVDVLVTDYSSIFFDFIARPRPVLYYIPDVAAYESVQGDLCLPWDALPGEKCDTPEALRSALGRALTPQNEVALDASYSVARQRFCPYEDGRAAQRTLAFFFDDIGQQPLMPKVASRVLVYAGDFHEADIDRTLLAAIRQHFGSDSAYAVAVDPWEIDGFAERLLNLARDSDGYELMARVGHMPMSEDESPVVECFLAGRAIESEPMRRLLHTAFSREYRRLFGGCQFDVIIDLSGRSPFWAGILAFGAVSGVQRYRLGAVPKAEPLGGYVHECYVREQVLVIGNLGVLANAQG